MLTTTWTTTYKTLMDSVKTIMKNVGKSFNNTNNTADKVERTIKKLTSVPFFQSIGVQCETLNDGSSAGDIIKSRLKASADTLNAAISVCGNPDITDPKLKADLHKCLDDAAIKYINDIGQESNNKHDYTSIEEFMESST